MVSVTRIRRRRPVVGRSPCHRWQAVMIAALSFCLVAAAVRAADPPSRADVEELLARRAFAEAESAARVHLAAVEATHGSESLATADALDLLTLVLVESERAATPETFALVERAVAVRERLQGADSPALADSLRGLGKLATTSNQLDKAASCLGRAQAIYRRQLGDEDALTIEVTVVLASVSYRRGDYRAAQALLEAVLPVQERLLGPDHAKVAGTVNGLASTLYQLGEYTQARELWERALDIRRRTLGPDDPALAQSLNNVALARYREADFVGALQQYREALAHRRRTLPSTDPRIGYSLNGCAYTLSRTGDLGAARDLFEQVLAIFEPALGPEHPETVQTVVALSELALETGDVETGLALTERAAAGAIKAFGPRHHTTCTIRASYAHALLQADRPADARREVEDALAILREIAEPYRDEIAKALIALAAVDEREGKLDSALAHLEEARRIRERTLGPDHPYVADCLHRQARVTQATGRPRTRPRPGGAWPRDQGEDPRTRRAGGGGEPARDRPPATRARPARPRPRGGRPGRGHRPPPLRHGRPGALRAGGAALRPAAGLGARPPARAGLAPRRRGPGPHRRLAGRLPLTRPRPRGDGRAPPDRRFARGGGRPARRRACHRAGELPAARHPRAG